MCLYDVYMCIDDVYVHVWVLHEYACIYVYVCVYTRVCMYDYVHVYVCAQHEGLSFQLYISSCISMSEFVH